MWRNASAGVLPEGTAARVNLGAWQIPALFGWLQRVGEIPIDDMFRTFNMGIGLIIVCTPALVDPVLEDLRSRSESPVVMGEIIPGDCGVVYD